ARYEPESAVEEEAGHPDLRRVVEDLLLVADEEVPRARNEPSKEAPVESTERQHEEGERQPRRDQSTDEVAPGPERGVCDHQTEPDRDEPCARRKPGKRPDERA